MRKGLRLDIVALCLVATCYLLASCQKDISDSEIQGPVNLQVHFKPMVNADELIVGKAYKNAFGEDYSVSAFKFYIHHFYNM